MGLFTSKLIKSNKSREELTKKLLEEKEVIQGKIDKYQKKHDELEALYNKMRDKKGIDLEVLEIVSESSEYFGLSAGEIYRRMKAMENLILQYRNQTSKYTEEVDKEIELIKKEGQEKLDNYASEINELLEEVILKCIDFKVQEDLIKSDIHKFSKNCINHNLLIFMASPFDENSLRELIRDRNSDLSNLLDMDRMIPWQAQSVFEQLSNKYDFKY